MYAVPKLETYSPSELDKAEGELLRALEEESHRVSNEGDAKAFRDRWLARKTGIVTQLNEFWLKAAPASAKPEVGKRLNEIRPKIEDQVKFAQLVGLVPKLKPSEKQELRVETDRLVALDREQRLKSDALDITLPGIRHPLGAEHPIVRTMNDIVGVFKAMGGQMQWLRSL